MSQTTAIIVAAVISAVISYLIGSISFSIIFTKIFTNRDVRDYGSGNAGMTNTFRAAGKLPGILTLFCDCAKGIVAVIIGYLIFKFALPAVVGEGYIPIDPIYGKYIAGLAVLLGHIYPCYFGFKGGKGVLTSIGIIYMLDWRVGFCVLGAFIIVFLITRIVSVSSLTGAFVYPIATFFLFAPSEINEAYMLATGTSPFIMVHERLAATACALLFALIVWLKHSSNIKRIIKGEESKVNFKKKQSKTEA